MDKEKGKYTKSDRHFKAKENQIKVSKYEDTNLMLVKFCESGKVTESSLLQYKSAIRRCEERFSKSIINVTKEEIEEYALSSSDKLPTINAQRNYIIGFVRFYVLEKFSKGIKVVDSDMFLYLFLDTKTGITVDLAKQYIL